MALGLGDSISYENLISQLTGGQIDKSSQMTDWSLRPLSDRQLKYALSDVTHLCDVYELLLERLASSDRTSWVENDMEALLEGSGHFKMEGLYYMGWSVPIGGSRGTAA